jgi:predicted transcriptional regulator
MGESYNSEFETLMQSLSSNLAFQILDLYETKETGYSLTETARTLDHPVSTVQEYLKRFQNTSLIFKKEKKYVLSNFGSYILSELREFKKVSKLNEILGKIPANMIPDDFISVLVKDLSNMKIDINSVDYMSILHETGEKLKTDVEEGDHTFKLMGWWDLEMDLGFFRTIFKELELDIPTFTRFYEHFDIKLIINENLYEEIENHPKIYEIIRHFSAKEEIIRVYEEFNGCKFSILRYDHYVLFFLIKDNDIDFKNMVFFSKNKNALEFFELLFDYYWEQATN